MKIILDLEKQQIIQEHEDKEVIIDQYSKEAFELISDLWLKIGWNQKYTYTFSWLDRPIIQLPSDMFRIQEVIYSIKPNIIIETGVAHGGSIIFYASLCKLIGFGRVIGIDVEIRQHNRSAIENHELYPYLTLIEGNSISPEVIEQVRDQIKPDEKVMVILDSNHTKEHVLGELEGYHDLVTSGSYIVVNDGYMESLFDTPRGRPDWKWNNPVTSVTEFLRKHPEFSLEQPSWLFNESALEKNVTHWPKAWLKKS